MTRNNPFLLALQRRDALSPDEMAIIEKISSWRSNLPAKWEIVGEGDTPTTSCLLLSGFAARYSVLADGRRQITAIHTAGDFVDLHSFLLARMDHSVTLLTDCTVSKVPHAYLRDITEQHPHFTRLLWLLTIIDAATYRRWLLAAGRLSSAGQIAHFFCEMFVRLQVVEQTDGFVFSLPISQGELSDAMGLSIVHVNRTLQALRSRKIISWQGDEFRILDWNALKALAEFDPTYLNLHAKAR
jgi:CRP-like cAMP-binding protein